MGHEVGGKEDGRLVKGGRGRMCVRKERQRGCVSTVGVCVLA
jgi:hypothetical protein